MLKFEADVHQMEVDYKLEDGSIDTQCGISEGVDVEYRDFYLVRNGRKRRLTRETLKKVNLDFYELAELCMDNYQKYNRFPDER